MVVVAVVLLAAVAPAREKEGVVEEGVIAEGGEGRAAGVAARVGDLARVGAAATGVALSAADLEKV